MDSFLGLLYCLLIGAVVSNAALLPSQVYWQAVLPNTRMPAALHDLLNSGKTEVYVGASKGRQGSIIIPDCSVNLFWGAAEEHLHDNLQGKYFFLERDLHPGSKMNLRFDRINVAAKFLSRSEAESIPFSSMKLPEIISQFSVQSGSDEEKAMNITLWGCEDPGLKGEKKMCATSLESIVDFTVATLGTRNIMALSTVADLKNGALKQEYTIVPSGVKNLAQDDLVGCHRQTYPYAVFHCHLAKSTKIYMVKMTGKDGTMVDAVAVCHADTAAWNPKHVAFRTVNVKPGTVPVCHFIPQNDVVFIRNNKSTVLRSTVKRADML